MIVEDHESNPTSETQHDATSSDERPVLRIGMSLRFGREASKALRHLARSSGGAAELGPDLERRENVA